MKTKGSWTISNLKGVPRIFKDNEDPEAIAWMSNRDDTAPAKPRPVRPNLKKASKDIAGPGKI